MGLLNTWDYQKRGSYSTNNKLNSKHNEHNNKQNKHNNKHSKQNKHNNTWLAPLRQQEILGMPTMY